MLVQKILQGYLATIGTLLLGLASDLLRDVARPAQSGIEGHDPHHFVLGIGQVSDQCRACCVRVVGLAAGLAEGVKILQHSVDVSIVTIGREVRMHKPIPYSLEPPARAECYGSCEEA